MVRFHQQLILDSMASATESKRDLSILKDIGDRNKDHGFYSTKTQNPKARDIFNQPLVFVVRMIPISTEPLVE